MDDKDFLDLLYQQWSQTTCEENQFWIVEKQQDYWDVDPGHGEEVKYEGIGYDIVAVSADAEQRRTKIGWFDREVDADFVAGLHGAVGDLVRRMHDALDEADRLDRERDEAEQNVFRLAVENEELSQEAGQLRRERELWVSRAGDTLWKIERPM